MLMLLFLFNFFLSIFDYLCLCIALHCFFFFLFCFTTGVHCYFVLVSFELKWNEPDEEALVEFMVKEKGFR